MMNDILSVGVALLAGLLLTRLFTRLKLPDVTAYLVAGVLVGPYVLGRLGIPGLGFAAPEDVDGELLSWLEEAYAFSERK